MSGSRGARVLRATVIVALLAGMLAAAPTTGAEELFRLDCQTKRWQNLETQLLKRAEANLERTVPDSRMRDAESVRHEILSNLAMMFTQEGTEGHEDELDFYECKFLRALRFLRIDHVRKALSERNELTDLPEADDGEGEAAFDDEMLARLSRMASIGPSSIILAGRPLAVLIA